MRARLPAPETDEAADVRAPPGDLAPTRACLEPWAPAEILSVVSAGANETDELERLVVQLARAEGALDLAIGEGLAALMEGDRLIALGFSGLPDYAREVLDLKERNAQALAQLARELRTRPLLRAALRAGEVRLRHAQTILPVAVGADEARWVDRARRETVRALEAAVREERGRGEPQEEWVRLRARLSPEDRATVDEALAVAGKVMPGTSRAERLEAMAQEYVAEHPLEAGDDGGGLAGGAFGADRAALRDRLEARLEEESERWEQPRLRRGGCRWSRAGGIRGSVELRPDPR